MQATRPTLANYIPEVVAPGGILLRRGEQSRYVLFLDFGRVATSVDGNDGVVHQLGFLEGPSWLEASAAVLSMPCAVDAIAQTEVQVRRVPLKEFLANLRGCEAGCHAMLTDVSKAHRQQTDVAISRLVKDANARCAEWLLGQARPNSNGTHSVKLQLTKRLLAAQLGIAPETLSRVFRSLRDGRLISGSGRVVNLVDLSGLRSTAGL